MTIAIVLGRSAIDSRVLIDGNDVTASVIGVEIRAFIGEASHVTLTLSSRVEITGESGIRFKGPERMALDAGLQLVDAICDKDQPQRDEP